MVVVAQRMSAMVASRSAFLVVVGRPSGRRIEVHIVVDLERVARRSVGLMAGAVACAVRARKVRGRGRGRGLGSVVVVVVVAFRLWRPWRWSVHGSNALMVPAGSRKCRFSELLGSLGETENWWHRRRLHQGFISSDASCLAVTSGLCLPDVTSPSRCEDHLCDGPGVFFPGSSLKTGGDDCSRHASNTARHKGNVRHVPGVPHRLLALEGDHWCALPSLAMWHGRMRRSGRQMCAPEYEWKQTTDRRRRDERQERCTNAPRTRLDTKTTATIYRRRVRRKVAYSSAPIPGSRVAFELNLDLQY